MNTETLISNLHPGDTCRLPMVGHELTVIRKSAGSVRVRHAKGNRTLRREQG